MINRLNDTAIRQTTLQETTTEQTEESTAQSTPQEPERTVQDRPSYSSSLIAEQRFGSYMQEAYLRSTLDRQLAGAQVTTPPATGVQIIGTQSTGSAASIQSELSFGSQGEEVKTLQTELNQWRAKVGFDPLPVTGYFGKDTEAALKEYQDSCGIKTDGIFGPVTKDNLTLENDPNFAKLDFNLQQQVKVQMSSYEKDPDRRRMLLNVATNPNFQECDSPRTRQAVLNRIENGPVTPELQTNLDGYLELRTSMAKDPTFQELSPEMQDKADMQMEQYHSYSDQGKLHGLVTEPNFGKLDDAHQREAINTLNMVRLGDSTSYESFMNIIRNPSFTGMNGDVQSRIMEAAGRNGTEGASVRDLASLVTNPQFAAMSPGQQKAALDVYLIMHPGDVPIGS